MRTYLILTEISYKPCFNRYTGTNRSHKLYNTKYKRNIQSFLYNVLDTGYDLSASGNCDLVKFKLPLAC